MSNKKFIYLFLVGPFVPLVLICGSKKLPTFDIKNDQKIPTWKP
jgi:hypothetical protein